MLKTKRMLCQQLGVLEFSWFARSSKALRGMPQVYQELVKKHPSFRERSERVDLSVSVSLFTCFWDVAQWNM